MSVKLLFVVFFVDMAGQLPSVLLAEYTQINRQGYAPLRNWDAWRTCWGVGGEANVLPGRL